MAAEHRDRGPGITGGRRCALLTALSIFMVGVSVSSAWASFQVRSNRLVAKGRFDLLTQSTLEHLAIRLGVYEYGLRGARGAFSSAGTEGVSYQGFRDYSQSADLAREFPGALGFGIIRRISPQAAAEFTAKVRHDQAPDFAVRRLAQHPGDLFITQYIEPLEPNREALGFDIASDEISRRAAEQALLSGRATLTAPLTLVQARDKPGGSFLLLLPIYAGQEPRTTPEQRQAATLGWSFCPLLIDAVFAGLDLGNGLSLAVRDVEQADGRAFFASEGFRVAPADGLSKRSALAIYGRRWQAELRATPAFVASLNLRDPGGDAGSGVGVAALLAVLGYLFVQNGRRKAEVRAEQARRAAIVDGASYAIIAESLDGIITDWNQSAERLFGYPAELALARPAAALILPEARAREDAEIRRAVSAGESLPSLETTRRRADGALIEVAITVSPIVTPEGRRVGFSMMVRDIGKQREAEQRTLALNASLERQVVERTALLDAARRDLQNILDAVPSLVSYWDRNLRNRFANRAHQIWFGRDPAELRSEAFTELHGVSFGESRRFVEAALRGETQMVERTLPSVGDRGARHVLAHYVPDEVDGEVIGFYVFASDVTQQTESKALLAAALRDKEALLAAIHEHAIVSHSDHTGLITDVSPGFCEISGYTKQELVGQSHRIVNSGRHDAAFWVELWRTIAGGKSWRGEICNRAKDGSLYWVDSLIAPLVDGDGRIEKYVAIRFDVTAARLAEEALRESQAFLDRAGRVAGIGAWQFDLATRQLAWSSEMFRIHELDPDQLPSLAEALDSFGPEPRARVEQAVREAVESKRGWDLELPMVTARDQIRWIRMVGEVECADDGTVPVRLVGMMQDITARKQIEISLAEERHLIGSLLENVPDRIHFKDTTGRVLRANPAFARHHGLASAEQAIGKTEADFMSSLDAQRVAALESTMLKGKNPIVDLEEETRSSAGARTWSLTTRMPFRDVDGRISGTFCISRDITARKLMEAELTQTHERIALAAEAAGIGVWEFDVPTNSLLWDDRMYHLYARAPKDKLEPYALWASSLHPADRERAQQELVTALNGEHPFDTEFRIIRGDGETRHLKAAARVVRDSGGAPLRMTGVNLDITDRKRAELELLETSSLLQTVLGSASEVSIIATDPNLVIKVFNRGAERLLGYSETEVVNRATPLLIHDASELRARVQEITALSGGVFASASPLTDPLSLGQPREWTYIRKDRSRVTVSLVVTAMESADGTLFGYLGVAHDVTRQKEYEQTLRDATHKAEQASKAKGEFLANMSHEIRTPMNAVIGLSFLLGQTALDSEQAALLSKISVASKSLLALINDILDFSKIEAGELSIENVAFNLPDLLEMVRDVTAHQASSKGILFAMHAADVPSALEGDVTRLNQILTNLLANAVKFTTRGGVTLRVRQEPAASNRVKLRFEVEDTGIGIAPDVQERLFAPFAQADASTTRRFGGTGLGLSIVKRLAELMGGEIGLSSKPGRGSTFWVTVSLGMAQTPVVRAELNDWTEPGACRLLGVRVLVVDDSDINLYVARHVLEREGARVTVCSDGKEAIDRLGSEPEGYDAVLMDVQMPVMDGYEATRRIREQLYLNTIPIIALTADARTSERTQCLAAGMDDFISKPFEPDALVRCLRRHVDPQSAPPSLVPGSHASPSRAGLLSQRPPKARGAPSAPGTQGVRGWPSLDGVDSETARARFGGDLALFGAALRRLLMDFSDLTTPPEAMAVRALPEQADRMRALCSGAGQLGAELIEQLAGQLETACRHRDDRRAIVLLKRLSVQFQILRYSVELTPGLAAPLDALPLDPSDDTGLTVTA